MSDAQTILKMIESVDPADTAKLDEIDARVYAFLNKMVDDGLCWVGDRSVPLWQFIIARDQQQPYTRSRDALKSIRPEGWYFSMSQTAGQSGYRGALFFFGWCENPPSDRPSWENASPKLPTEELAELHAVIQAIDYERGRE